MDSEEVGAAQDDQLHPAETWETINRRLLASARQEKIEAGKVVRFDSTVTAALMHEPSDSSLLWDAVRVTARLLETSDTLVGGLEWRNHRRAAKKRARIIEYAATDGNGSSTIGS